MAPGAQSSHGAVLRGAPHPAPPDTTPWLRLVQRLGRAHIERRGRHWKWWTSPPENLAIQIQREGGEGQNEQQHPHPQSECTVNVEIDAITAGGEPDLPGGCSAWPPAPRRRAVARPSRQRFAGSVSAKPMKSLPHSGRILGLPGRILISLMGLVVAILSVTGVVIWARKRRCACASEFRR